MKLIFSLLLLLPMHFCASGQQVDSEKLINEIKLKVTDFFIQDGILNEATVKNNLDYVFVTEIHDKKNIGYNLIGIYKIGVFISHTPQNILIKEGSNYRIFDINKIDILLKELIEYSSRNKIDRSLMFFYIKDVINTYEQNNKKDTEILF